jgi:cytochrome c biogenesis protein CcmG/thiol:disulfide interchange protein DsbE
MNLFAVWYVQKYYLILFGIVALALTSCQYVGSVAGYIILRQVPREADTFLQEAPDFDFVTYSGEQIKLSELRGKVVIINFWSSWCPPCLSQLLELQNIREQYPADDVAILGIAYLDMASSALESVNTLHLTYHIGSDNGTEIADAFGVQGIPETFVVDRQGQIKVHLASLYPADKLTSIVDEILKN